VKPIEAARLQNEPLQKLYRSLLKVGYSPLFNMPYGEFFLGSMRSREMNYDLHLRHLSGTPHFKDFGYGGWSSDGAGISGKKFYRRHSLSGSFLYDRNLV